MAEIMTATEVREREREFWERKRPEVQRVRNALENMVDLAARHFIPIARGITKSGVRCEAYYDWRTFSAHQNAMHLYGRRAIYGGAKDPRSVIKVYDTPGRGRFKITIVPV